MGIMINTEQERLERQRAIKRRWRAKHREAYNAAQKRWRDNNPEKAKEIAQRSYQKVWPSWRAKNREKHNAYLLAYYHKNKERCKSYVSAEAKARNRERLKAWVATLSPEVEREMKRAHYAQYIAKFRDVINAKRRERHDAMKAKLAREKYKAANPDRVKILARKGRGIRRARLRAATIGDLTDIHKIYERCHWWKQWFDVVVDHVISLARGGTHEAKNLQIIYRFENEKKGARQDYKPRVVFT